MVQPLSARTRIVDTARRLFYAEGVHAIGVDRIIADANVAKATFYHHFPAKDDLVRTYVEEQSRGVREATAHRLAEMTGRRAILAAFDAIAADGLAPEFRGCPFINAAAEYPDADHPVRQAIGTHRRWFRELLRSHLEADRDPDPERKADMLVRVKDGLYVGLDLDDPAAIRRGVRDHVMAVLHS
jgi:AcrR family transcriptional regulator